MSYWKEKLIEQSLKSNKLWAYTFCVLCQVVRLRWQLTLRLMAKTFFVYTQLLWRSRYKRPCFIGYYYLKVDSFNRLQCLTFSIKYLQNNLRPVYDNLYLIVSSIFVLMIAFAFFSIELIALDNSLFWANWKVWNNEKCKEV